MTQPQYPPQGYAPQPQYAPPAPPQGYAPPAPQYAPQPQQAPPAPGYGGAHPQGHDSFRPPDPQQSNIVRPRMLDFARSDRLVMISPTKIDRGKPNNLGKPGDTQDVMTADVVILDGGPIMFGGAPEKNIPHTHQAQPPYEILGLWIPNGGLITQCERRLGETVLGRIGIKNLANGNTAYKIENPTDEDMNVCRAYQFAKLNGQVHAPAQVMAAQPYAGPPPQAQQAQYMTQPAALPPYAGAQPPAPQYAPQPAYAPPAPQQAQYDGAPVYGAPTPPAPQQASYGPPPPAAALDLDTCPPNIDPNWWRDQPPEVRMMYVGQAQSRPGV